MEQLSQFTVVIDGSLPVSQREALVAALQGADVQLSEPATKDFGATVVVILAVIGGAATVSEGVKKVAEAGSALVKLGQDVVAWRSGARAAGATPAARLEATGRPALDLATATDQQVLAWFLGGEE